MNEAIRDILENRHNVYIDPKTDQYNLVGYEEQYGWQPIPKEWMICECCGAQKISDDPELAAEMLCDRCNREINEDAEIIGWGKGE